MRTEVFSAGYLPMIQCQQASSDFQEAQSLYKREG